MRKPWYIEQQIKELAEQELGKLKNDNNTIFINSALVTNNCEITAEKRRQIEESVLFSNSLDNIVEVLTKWSRKEGILTKEDALLLQFFEGMKECRDKKQIKMQELLDKFTKNNQSSPYVLDNLIAAIEAMLLLLPNTYFNNSSLNQTIAYKVKDLCDLIQNCSIQTLNTKTFQRVKDLKKTITGLESLNSIRWFGSIFDKCLDENDFAKIEGLLEKYKESKAFPLIFAAEIKKDYDSLSKLQEKHKNSLEDNKDKLMEQTATAIKKVFEHIKKNYIDIAQNNDENYDTQVQKKLDEKIKKDNELSAYLKNQAEDKRKQAKETFKVECKNTLSANGISFGMDDAVFVINRTLEEDFGSEQNRNFIQTALDQIKAHLLKNGTNLNSQGCDHYYNVLNKLKDNKIFTELIFSITTVYDDILILLKKGMNESI